MVDIHETSATVISSKFDACAVRNAFKDRKRQYWKVCELWDLQVKGFPIRRKRMKSGKSRISYKTTKISSEKLIRFIWFLIITFSIYLQCVSFESSLFSFYENSRCTWFIGKLVFAYTVNVRIIARKCMHQTGTRHASVPRVRVRYIGTRGVGRGRYAINTQNPKVSGIRIRSRLLAG